MAPIRILIVVDGIFNYRVSDPTDQFFTITFLIQTLQNSRNQLFSIDTAHRDGDPNAKIPGKFNFSTSVPTLRVYDEIWMIGYNGSNISGSPSLHFIGDNELEALATFMESGGGVLAVGDHDGLGSLMCSMIPRVRTMRKWFSSSDSDPRIPGAAPRNWPGYGPTRADTLVPDHAGQWNFDNQSDDIPQTLEFPGGVVHPLLRGSIGPIRSFPDHMHEGEVLGFGGIPGQVPWALRDTLEFNGRRFTEYPIVNNHQEVPTIIATGTVTEGHSTIVEGSACEQANFGSDRSLTVHNKINILAVYDGHKAGIGRVVTDSSFHHFIDLNLIGDPCGAVGKTQGFTTPAGRPYLQGMRDFFTNVAIWLAGPRVQAVSCLGEGATDARVYSIQPGRAINEKAWHPGHWANSIVPAGATQQGTPIASLGLRGFHGIEPRIYYVDFAGHIREVAWNGHWRDSILPGELARENTSICCFVHSGTSPRVYYVDTLNRINELALIGSSWVNTPLPNKQAREGSPLTCFATNNTDARIFYIDTDGKVNQLSWIGGWLNTTLPSNPALSESGLACVLLGSEDIRIYYSDIWRRINELSWQRGRGWGNNGLQAFTGQHGGAMACLGVNHRDPRVYYINESATVCELAWKFGHWSNTALPGIHARWTTGLSCYSFSTPAGTEARVYYIGQDQSVTEASWDGLNWSSKAL